MSDEIEEISERHTMYPPSRPSSSSRYSFIVAYQDIATLLAEVDRLRAEIEGLREALRRIGMPLNKVAFCRDGHEIAVLLARNALEGKP